MSDADLPYLYSQYQHDPDMRELVEQFVAELPDRRAELRSAAQRGDLATALRLSHQLKGASGGYGFGPLGDTAAGVEDALKRLAGSAEASSPTALLRVAEPLLTACDRVRIASAA